MPETSSVEERRCTAEGVAITTATRFTAARLARSAELATALAATARANGGSALVMATDLMRLSSELRETGAGIEETELAVCPFDGDVEVTHDPVKSWWTCPVCRTEYVEPVMPGDDR